MLKNIKAVFLDLDGTLYFKKQVIPGAVSAIRELRKKGYLLRFLTNTDSKTTQTLCSELLGYGIMADLSEIHTPAVTALNLLKEEKGTRVFPLVSNELMDSFLPYRGTVPGDTQYVVIGDFRDKVSYDLINEAFWHVDAGAEILALQQAGYFYTLHGKNVDTGAFVALFEYASGKTARLLGKPSPDFFMTAVRDLGLTPGQVCIVGDDPTTDIKGANRISAAGVLVKTGKFTGRFRPETEDIRPAYIIDSIKDLPDLLGR